MRLAAVTETYTYGGLGGRVSSRLTVMNTGNYRFRQGFAWDELGNLSSLTYRRCEHGTCTRSPATTTPRNQSFTYDLGRLSVVPGFANRITYHPNGLFREIRHSNGATDHQVSDPTGQPRPLRLYTTGTDGNFSSGIYRYDGAGNITKMGSDWYTYDATSRLTETSVRGQQLNGSWTTRRETYRHDRYGNLTGLGSRNFSVIATSNRLSATPYDVAGNQLSWAGQGFRYDAVNQMTRLDGNGNNVTHVYTTDDERCMTLENPVTGYGLTGRGWALSERIASALSTRWWCLYPETHTRPRL